MITRLMPGVHAGLPEGHTHFYVSASLPPYHGNFTVKYTQHVDIKAFLDIFVKLFLGFLTLGLDTQRSTRLLNNINYL